MLILMGLISDEESEKLRKFLLGKEIPKNYKAVIEQIEEGLGRKLKIPNQ